MKRRVLALLLVCALLLPVTASHAAIGRIGVYGIINNAATHKITTIPTTTIRARYHRIIGISIIDTSGSGSSECFASIEDIVQDGSGGTVAEIIAEAEFGAGGGSEWFVYPLLVTTQIKVRQGAYTEVLLTYAH